MRSFNLKALVILCGLLINRTLLSAAVDAKYWNEAFEYLKLRKANSEIEALTELIQTHQPKNGPLLEAILEHNIALKNRNTIHTRFRAFYEINNCKSVLGRGICELLQKLWKDRLSSLLFYDSSAALVEKARRSLLVNDCRSAQAALEELEVKEGLFLSLAQDKLRVAKCFNDRSAQLRAEAEIERLMY